MSQPIPDEALDAGRVEEIARNLSEREGQLVIMANLGHRIEGWERATVPECEPLAARGLMVEGINIATGAQGGSFYPTELGKRVAQQLEAAA